MGTPRPLAPAGSRQGGRMTRLRDLPVTVVIVASIGVPLLSAVGLVTWASLDIARRNTVL